MKTILKFGCGFFFFIVFLFVVLLKFGQSSGEEAARTFFDHVNTEAPESFGKYMHASLLNEADPEMVSQFFKELLKQHGSFQGLNMNGMNFSDKTSGGERVQEYKGTFRFERKEIPLEISFLNGQLLAFTILDEAVAQQLVQATKKVPAGPKTKYEKQTEQFWRLCLGGQPQAAFDMLNIALQKQFGQDKFNELFNGITAKQGKVQEVKFLSWRPKEPNGSKALFFFNVDFSGQKNVLAHSTVEFVGFKGHLVGFQIPSDEKP